MMAILAPDLQRLRLLASLIACAMTASVPLNDSILCPMAPLVDWSYLTTCAFMEQAKIFTSGLYFDVNLANLPDSVRTMIKAISFWSRTAEQTADETASVVPTGPGV